MIQTSILNFVNKRNYSYNYSNEKIFKKLKKINNEFSIKNTLGNHLSIHYTNEQFLLYKYHSLVIIYNNITKNYSLYTTESIRLGQLLLIEKGIIGSPNYIEKVLENYPDIIKELYPRNISKNDNIKIIDKINKNSWQYSDKEDNDLLCYQDSHIICPFLSKVNHKCNFNSAVVKIIFSDLYGDKDNYSGGFALYATSDIPAYSEIYTSYGHLIGHESKNKNFNWKCDCNLSRKDRRNIFNYNLNLAKDFWNNDKEYCIRYLI
jgi:hypothetical protein